MKAGISAGRKLQNGGRWKRNTGWLVTKREGKGYKAQGTRKKKERRGERAKKGKVEELKKLRDYATIR
jgi:hypothetical protein